MSLAILILAHKNSTQVERLFNAVYHRDDCFVLHFDRRAPVALHELGGRLVSLHPNVRLLPSQEIFWGGSMMAEVQLAAMQTALRFDSEWTHFINLTGQDFPIKSREETLRLLATNPGKSYLSWFDPLVPPGLWLNARERLTRYHLNSPWLHHLLAMPVLGRRIRWVCGWQNRLPYLPVYRRKIPDFFRYFGGANHVVLARAAVRHLLEDPVAKRLRHWLSAAGHSDEILFQSALLNSPLASSLINTTLREIDFPPHSPHPRIFTTADLPRLRASSALYARKFDLTVDPGIFDALEEISQPTLAFRS